MKESNALAQKVKQLRIANNLTQSDVARELNVSPGFISNVENGRTAMSLRLLIYYAKMTGTTLDMLVGDMIPEYRVVIPAIPGQHSCNSRTRFL